MNYRLLIIFILTLSLSESMTGQATESDTAQLLKVRKRKLSPLEFDSARISTNGQYAIILKGDYLNGCDIYYWTLYERGLNKAISEPIIITKDSAYFVSYDKKNEISSLTGIQFNGNKFNWGISKKYKLADLVAKYDLKTKPIDRTDQLIVKTDTLSPMNKKIPAEITRSAIGDSVISLVHLVELKIIFNNRPIFIDTISFLPNPKDIENNFEDYLKRLREQVLKKCTDYSDNYGKYFLVSKNNYFLRLSVESYLFDGWNYLISKDGDAVTTRVSLDTKAYINLLK